MKRLLVLCVLLFTTIIYFNSSVYSKYTYGAGYREHVHYIKQGLTLMKNRQYSKALRYLYFASVYAPTRGSTSKYKVYSIIAYVYDKWNKPLKAIKFYKQAIVGSPRDVISYTGLVKAYLSLNKKEKAIKYAQILEKATMRNRNILLGLGEIYKLLKNHNKSANFYKDALKLNPKDVIALQGLAESYMELGYYEKALLYLSKALKTNKRKVISWNMAGILYAKKGDYEKAEKIYLSLIRKIPNFSIGYYNLACVYSKAGKINKALESLEHSFKLNSSFIKQAGKDKDLKNIRNTEKFKKLIKKYTNLNASSGRN